MFKWFLAAAVAALLTVFIIWQRNGVKTTYVNGLPAYSALPNREFIIEHDCYIFKFKDSDTAWPLIGASGTVPALPSDVDPKNVGASFPDVRILDVVRSGSRVKIVSVRRDAGRASTTVTFEILFMDAQERKYPRLDAFYLLDHVPEKDGAAPTFLENYVVPRVKK